MAITVTKDTPQVERLTRNLGILTGSIAFDASYPTGGEGASDITRYFKTTHRILFDATGGYLFAWDKANSKILVYYPTDETGTPGDRVAAQVANAADLSGITAVHFIATGLI